MLLKLLLRAAALALLIATAAPASSKDMSLRVQYYGGVVHEITLYTAVAEELFKKNGLTVELISMNSGPNALAALSGGSVDVAVGNPDIMLLGLQSGLGLQAICAGSGPYFEMVAKPSIPEAPYPQVMQSVKGKRIGITAPGASGQFFADALLEGANMGSDDVSYVGVGTLTAVEAMQNGRIDAYMSFEPVTTLLESTTDARVVWSLAGGTGPKLLTNLGVGLIWFGKADKLKDNPEPYKAFVRSLEQARKFAADPANADRVTDDVIRLAKVNSKALPGGDDTLRKMVHDKLLKVHAVSKFSSEEAAAWLGYMQKYQPKALSGDYVSGDPKSIMADKVWESACR